MLDEKTMNPAFVAIALAVVAAGKPAVDNPVFSALVGEGVVMSDRRAIKLPPPILPDGLDAAGQRAALQRAADANIPLDRLLQKSFYAPVVVKVRTLKAENSSDDERPAVRAVDLWFVVHGDWDVLTSKEFLESLAGGDDAGPDGVVSKSGVLTDGEMTARKLSAKKTDSYEERFVYSTFTLFERVEISSTRLAGLSRGDGSLLAAGRIDRSFDDDPDYPNRWRALLRDARAEIAPGPAHPFRHAGGYAKITRLEEPVDAVFIECHLVYEEDYGWFDGANLVKQKAPLIVREKVRVLRRKLVLASEQSAKKPETKN